MDNDKPVLPLGSVVATPGALEQVPTNEITAALTRHASGDWGDVGEEVKEANDQALSDNARVVSVYATTNGTKFWVVTEGDRSVTTVMLPDEY